MKIILSLHPIFQLTGIILAYYAGFLGIQRARSLHFDQKVPFKRKRHAIIGAVALIILLGGFFGGLVIENFLMHEHEGGSGLHTTGALILFPLFLVGLATGYYLYRFPEKQKRLSLVHGLNNLTILILLLVQIYSGWHKYLHSVIGGE